MKWQLSFVKPWMIVVASTCLITGNVQATASSMTQPVKAVHTIEQADQGISAPRRIAGFGFLAFLIGWLFWRNHTKTPKDTEETNSDGKVDEME